MSISSWCGWWRFGGGWFCIGAAFLAALGHGQVVYPTSVFLSVWVLAAQVCPTLGQPMDCSLPGSSVRGVFQARYWSGLPFSSPGDLPNPRIKPGSPTLQEDSLPFEPPGKPFLMSKMEQMREFPGCLVVRILHFHCHCPGSMPGLGTKILQAARHSQNK